MTLSRALSATALAFVTGLSTAPVGEPLAGTDGEASVAPFQPYPPEGPPQPEPRLSEPFYLWLEHPAGETEIVEGTDLKIRWHWGGPIEKVRLYYWYENCRLGGKPRGEVGKVIGKLIDNVGEYLWKVPWMDTFRLRLRIAGYDAQGGRLATDEIGLFYRPRQLADLSGTFIAVIKERQRLYYYQEGKLRRMHIVSTAAHGYTTPTMKPGSYDGRRGGMGQVFHKSPAPRSRRYNCLMPYWMAITSSGSHGIHATSPRFYSRLGRPASHGCIRQHKADAEVIYGLAGVGTAVYVF
jgi:hypothetical protein